MYELLIPSRKDSLPSSERLLFAESSKGILAKEGGAPVGIESLQKAVEGRKDGGRIARDWDLEEEDTRTTLTSLSLGSSHWPEGDISQAGTPHPLLTSHVSHS